MARYHPPLPMTRYQTQRQTCDYCNTHLYDVSFDLQCYETGEIREIHLCLACISAYDLVTLNENNDEIVGFGKDIKELLK